MKAAIFKGPGEIEIGDRPDAVIKESTDAVVRVVLACVCGSDLWYYRGETEFPADSPIGHEFIGVVEKVGDDVKTVGAGDFVVSPFAYSDGTCPDCQVGMTTACAHGGFIPAGNGDGGQGELVRVPQADGTLVKVPGSSSPWIAAKRMGAERIIALSRHPDRQKLALEFGATDIVDTRGDQAVEDVKKLTGGVGGGRRPGMRRHQRVDADRTRDLPSRCHRLGNVGLPHGVEIPALQIFVRNVGVHGGPAPVRAYLPELTEDVLADRINPGKVFDLTTDLNGIADAYAAMDERRAIKSLVMVGPVGHR